MGQNDRIYLFIKNNYKKDIWDQNECVFNCDTNGDIMETAVSWKYC